MEKNSGRKLITRAETAHRLGRSYRSVSNYLRNGKLTKHVNELGQVRIDEEEVNRLITFLPAVPSSDLH